MKVPHDWLPLVISRTARRPPPLLEPKSSPSELMGRPLPPGYCELKKPKNTPPLPFLEEAANVPEAVSLSSSVLAGVNGAA